VTKVGVIAVVGVEEQHLVSGVYDDDPDRAALDDGQIVR
jgi:hypothetical protein